MKGGEVDMFSHKRVESHSGPDSRPHRFPDSAHPSVWIRAEERAGVRSAGATAKELITWGKNPSVCKGTDGPGRWTRSQGGAGAGVHREPAARVCLAQD